MDVREFARLVAMEAALQAAYARPGAITRATVAAVLATPAPPGPAEPDVPEPPPPHSHGRFADSRFSPARFQ